MVLGARRIFLAYTKTEYYGEVKFQLCHDAMLQGQLLICQEKEHENLNGCEQYSGSLRHLADLSVLRWNDEQFEVTSVSCGVSKTRCIIVLFTFQKKESQQCMCNEHGFELSRFSKLVMTCFALCVFEDLHYAITIRSFKQSVIVV